MVKIITNIVKIVRHVITIKQDVNATNLLYVLFAIKKRNLI